jgi:hypothetical protein
MQGFAGNRNLTIGRRAGIIGKGEQRQLGELLLGELPLVEATFDQAYQHLKESSDLAYLDAVVSREFGLAAVLGLAALGPSGPLRPGNISLLPCSGQGKPGAFPS